MSKKVNERIPVNSGDGAGFKKYNAVQTPWNKLFSYQESLHYASRFESVLSAAVAQAYRIIMEHPITGKTLRMQVACRF